MNEQELLTPSVHLEQKSERRLITEQEYLNNNKYLPTLVENALDIIMVLSCDGNIRFLSNSAKEILGNDPNLVTGSKIINYIHPSERKEFQNRFSALVQGTKKIDFSQFQVKHKNGKNRLIESISKKVKDANGEAVVMVNSRDITERARVQKVLEKSQKQLSRAQKISQVGSWEWDLEQGIVRWSKELLRTYGIKSSKLISDYDEFLQYLHPGDYEHFTNILKEALNNKKDFQVEYRITRPDGTERKMHAKGEVVCNGRNKPKKIIATGQDITEYREAEHELIEYSEQLKHYNAKQDMIIENERIQIARDIHDELGQMLAVLKMDVFLLKERAKQEIGEKFTAGFTDDMRNIFNRFNTLIKSVQRITSNLRPEVIDELGLGDALKWQCHDFGKNTGIECNFINEAGTLNDMIREYKNAIFRILQQALKNVEEHAEANKAKVKLTFDKKFFILKVWDNGTGIKDEKTTHPNSLGLLSMRERSHYLGGDITFSGKKNEGTTVTLKIPVDQIIFKY